MCKRFFVPVCLLSLIFGAASSLGAGEHQSGDGTDTAQTLKNIEQSWLQAEKNHDPASFEKLVTDDWIALTPDGQRQTKAERSAKIKNSHMGSASLGPMDVRVFGDTAVVTGAVDETAENSTHHYVYTDVFVKRDGKWLAVASQTALIK
jgi:ketosteroid isomerase-like protein